MRKIKINWGVLVLFLVLVSSCNRNNEVQPVGKKVYILSNEYNNNTNHATAKYFINDVSTTIDNPTTSKIYGEDLEVVGSDVYVLASRQPISGGAFSAIVYKNGVQVEEVPLSNGRYFNCLAVNGSDIYLAGSEYPSGGIPKVIFWKNGAISSITSNTGANATDARPYDMTVVGNDVYIAGYEASSASSFNRVAKYWKNGTAVTLNNTAGSSSAAHRIVVTGTDIYCSGDSENKPVYWKNGSITTLGSANGWSYGIAVNGTDVYTAGSVSTGSNIYNAAYWKNGTQTMLSNITSQGTVTVYGVGVDGNDVYIIGSIPNIGGDGAKSVYWKNGVVVDLGTVSGSNGYAYRLVVK